MKLFLILALILILAAFLELGIAFASEPWEFSGEFDRPPIDIWNEHPDIFDGTIIQKYQSDNSTNFDIKINQVFKGTIKADLVHGFISKDLDRIFEVGDRALIYFGENKEISIYSVKTGNDCDARAHRNLTCPTK